MLEKSTERTLSNFLTLPLILLEEKDAVGVLGKQMNIKHLNFEIVSYIERNPNSMFEIAIDNENYSLKIKHNLLENSRSRFFKITINKTWTDFKVEQHSESHENLWITLKKFEL